AVAAVVGPAALGGHADRAAAAALAAHPDPARGAAGVAEGARAARAHPVAAAVVPLALLGQAPQHLTPEILVGDPRVHPLAPRPQRLLEPLAEPVGEDALDAAEGVGEREIEPVEVGLATAEQRPAEHVQLVEIDGEPALEGVEEGEPLPRP